MCRETITVALCAPSAPPALTFTCGRLHMVSANRHVCRNALGSCTCFFGTCGAVERIASPEPFDLGEIAKVRCAACTPREDQVGERRHGRELADSPLLLRNAIRDSAAMAQFEQDRKILWNNAPACPFHGGSGLELDSPGNSDTEKSQSSDSSRNLVGDRGNPGLQKAGVSDLDSSSSSVEMIIPLGIHTTVDKSGNGLNLHMGLSASHWATTSSSSKSKITNVPSTDDSGLDDQATLDSVLEGTIERAITYYYKRPPDRVQDTNIYASHGRTPRKPYLDSAKKFLERA